MHDRRRCGCRHRAPSSPSASSAPVQGCQGRVRAAPRPEAVAEPQEVGLIDGIQHLGHRPLDDLVLQGGDAERAACRHRLSGYTRGSTGFGQYCPLWTRSCSRRRLASRSCSYSSTVTLSTPGTRCAPLPSERSSERGDIDVMQQCREPGLARSSGRRIHPQEVRQQGLPALCLALRLLLGIPSCRPLFSITSLPSATSSILWGGPTPIRDQRPVVFPRSPPPPVTSRRTLMGLLGSDMSLLARDVSSAPGGASALSHIESGRAAFAGAGASSASATCLFRESIPHPVQPLSTLRTPRYRDARKTRSRPACSALDGPDLHWQAHTSFPIAPRTGLLSKVRRDRHSGLGRPIQFRSVGSGRRGHAGSGSVSGACVGPCPSFDRPPSLHALRPRPVGRCCSRLHRYYAAVRLLRPSGPASAPRLPEPTRDRHGGCGRPESSSAGELHPYALTEPYVKLSFHTALLAPDRPCCPL